MQRLRRLLATIIAVLALGALVQVWHVHETTWDYRLWPAAAPEKVHFDGRDYHRSVGTTSRAGVATPVGHTSGGGEIWAGPRVRPDIVRTVIWVRHDDRFTSYGLMGGP